MRECGSRSSLAWLGEMLSVTAMSDPQPIAWMFKNPDGSVKFVLHDADRAEAWGRNFKGEVVPLYERPKEKKP
jgi:hypothetical protein